MNRPSGPTTDPQDFASRFDESHRVLWLIAAGVVGDRTLAEDVVQEASVIGLQKLQEFDPRTNFVGWMGQIVRNVGLNLLRRERRRRYLSLDADESAAPAAARQPAEGSVRVSADGQLPPLQQVFDDQVMKALAAIAPLPRACLLLRTIEGMEYAEISRLLDIPPGTAMSHVHRARSYLRERLSDQGRDRDGAARKGTPV